MDKKKIGKFLKSLRSEKDLTQIELSNRFDGIYSDALISKWERGDSVPNVDDLKRLAVFYSITVDEILNGERNLSVDFNKKYIIATNDWSMNYNPKDLYHIREEQEVLIETRFKELLRKMVANGLTLSEDKEFDFIVNHFYDFFLPAVDCADKKYLNNCADYGLNLQCSCEHCMDYIYRGLADVKFEIYKQSALMHKSSIDEKFWEANKKFVFKKHQNIWDDINHVIEDDEGALKARLSKIEDYEKDILLASFQKINVINTLETTGKMGGELYEKRYGRKYDEEKLTKRAIKILIENGAKLNRSLLGCWKVEIESYSIIDKLVELNKKYKAPLLVPVFEDGKYEYYYAKNTVNNREKLKIEYKSEVFGEDDYEKLVKLLYDGEKIILKPHKKWACGISEQGAFLYAREQLKNMSLQGYYDSRDVKQTNELLNNLDKLSLAEIREKYFPSDSKGQFIEDEKTMSKEDFNKKYYI